MAGGVLVKYPVLEWYSEFLNFMTAAEIDLSNLMYTHFTTLRDGRHPERAHADGRFTYSYM